MKIYSRNHRVFIDLKKNEYKQFMQSIKINDQSIRNLLENAQSILIAVIDTETDLIKTCRNLVTTGKE